MADVPIVLENSAVLMESVDLVEIVQLVKAVSEELASVIEDVMEESVVQIIVEPNVEPVSPDRLVSMESARELVLLNVFELTRVCELVVGIVVTVMVDAELAPKATPAISDAVMELANVSLIATTNIVVMMVVEEPAELVKMELFAKPSPISIPDNATSIVTSTLELKLENFKPILLLPPHAELTLLVPMPSQPQTNSIPVPILDFLLLMCPQENMVNIPSQLTVQGIKLISRPML